jgi:hypothetical protein
LTHRGTRSVYQQSLREAERVVSECAYFDRALFESVNRLDGVGVVAEVTRRLGFCHPDVARKYLLGEVLDDSRGRGSGQRIIHIPRRGW